MAPAESAQCIYGSTKVWPSSGGEETSTGRYVVDGFHLFATTDYDHRNEVGSGSQMSPWHDKDFWKTNETTEVSGVSYPVYAEEGGAKLKIEASGTKLVMQPYYSNGSKASSIQILKNENYDSNSLDPDTLLVNDLSDIEHWSGNDDDGGVLLTELAAPSIEIVLNESTPSQNYGAGIYVLQDSLTTTYNGKTYPVYYCSANKMYLYVSTGNNTFVQYSSSVNAGKIALNTKYRRILNYLEMC